MNKKVFVIVLFALVFSTLNFAVAQDVDNSTEVFEAVEVQEVQSVSNVSAVGEASKVSTHFDVESNTTFDVVGDYFKVKLSDNGSEPLTNAKVTFTVNGVNYNKNTDSSGIASLQIRLKDGTYNIVSKFAGNSKYKASSLTTKISVDNTREVESGLSNSEIQKIIDNAKANNVILFKGSSYSNINLMITKSLTLISNVDTTLKSGSSSPVITIKGSKASLTKIKGFKIEGNGDGIKIDGANYVTISGNDITTKGNGIAATGTKYLNITKNNLVKNSKNGITVADSSSTYIFNNKITGNAANGILVAKITNLYIHGNTISTNALNGIAVTKSVNGVTYNEVSKNIHINKNTVSKNIRDGILVSNAGDSLNIKSNSIEANHGNGISMSKVGSNTIQSNVISENWENGIQFFDNYVKPSKQEISYNAIFSNYHMDVEAKDTYYQENGERLQLGDNWYTDFSGVCPKIRTNNIKFTVTQIGPNKYQALFTDSNGNIASLLPDRILTYNNNGQKVSVAINGGAGVFTVDANNGDIVRATVDNSRRDNTHDLDTKTSKEINGKSPEYYYPAIPQYELFGDIGAGTGNGSGHGQGNGGNTAKGNGNSPQESADNTGNSTHSQNMDPSNRANNPVNDVSQPESAQTTSQASASDVGQASDANAGTQSVVKQILIDEDEFFKVSGISFIILLIILTILFYYRDDIREMKSKM
jgi:parallel beta-helix repeat protein